MMSIKSTSELKSSPKPMSIVASCKHPGALALGADKVLRLAQKYRPHAQVLQRRQGS